MIKFSDARMTDALPDILSAQPWAQAMAQAEHKLRTMLLRYSALTMVLTNLDSVAETTLDAMAVQLRAPNYEQDQPISVKRDLVRGALLYWSHVGTNGSLMQILTDIFSDAEIVEWFDYDADPHHFKVVTNNPSVTGDMLTQYINAAERIKRLSTVLDAVEIDLYSPEIDHLVAFAAYKKSKFFQRMGAE